MKYLLLLILAIIIAGTAVAQKERVRRSKFFKDTSVVNVEFSTDIRKLRNDKHKIVWLPAHIVMHFPDSSTAEENILVEPRGIYRKDNCDIAALMLNFKADSTSALADLKKLKLVGGCYMNSNSESYVLKEYLVYKIYNILSPMSFRVRLLHVTYNDAAGKVKPLTQYAFLIEDIKDVADRNDCKEVKRTMAAESTDRMQITFVSMFEYMVGNTDWSVPNYHNIKLIATEKDTLTRPFPVPYDFDYSGVVNAPYATPSEGLDIKTVRERYYRGYARTLDELQPLIAIYKEKHDAIMQCINNFNFLRTSDKKDISNYTEEFYDIINDKFSLRNAFINNAVQNQ